MLFARSFRTWEVVVAASATLAACIIPATLALSPPVADFSIGDAVFTMIFLADVRTLKDCQYPSPL